MRRVAHALLVLLILPALVTGQVTVTAPGVDFSATNNWTGPQQFADGTAAIPSIAWTSDADGTGTGFYRRAANEVTLTSNGVGAIRFGAGADSGGIGIVGAAGAGTLSWATTVGSGSDLILSREGAAILQLGADVNGAAVAQTLKAHDGITGTDIAGASLTLAPGKGTGAGLSGSVVINRDLRAATGTTAQTQAHAYITCPSKILSNTTATLTTLATIGLASNSGGSAMAYFTVVATDGTNFDTDAQEMNFAFVNKATVITTNASAAIGDATIGNSGSTTVGATITTGSALVNINVTPVFTTIVPTTVTGYVTITNNGAGAVTCQ